MALFNRESLFDCTGLVAVVTGGGTGIGLVMARALEANGATVYIVGRRQDRLAAAAKLAQHGKLIPLQGDVTSKASLGAMTSHIAADTGYVNLLIANAGIAGPECTNLNLSDRANANISLADVQARLWETSTEDVTGVFHTNVTAAQYTATAFLGLLDEGNKRGNVRQKSQILITSSIAGFHRDFPSSGLAYVTSKAAVTHLTKSLASYLIKWGIRVNGLAPGLFPSEMTPGEGLTEVGGLPLEVQPMGRAGREEEMAGTVLYLASLAGGYCAGNIMVLDGGRLGLLPATY